MYGSYRYYVYPDVFVLCRELLLIHIPEQQIDHSLCQQCTRQLKGNMPPMPTITSQQTLLLPMYISTPTHKKHLVLRNVMQLLYYKNTL